MSNLADFDPNRYESLVNSWLKAEEGGEQFPVNFDDAWKIAGYSNKGNAKRKLTMRNSFLKESRDYQIQKGEVFIQSDKSALCGRSSDLILLTTDAFKHFCLMAETEQGELIRQYFIEAEKAWKLVQAHRPEVAEEMEVLKMKLEIAKNEAIKAQAEATKAQCDEKAIELRQYIVTALPEPLQQKILGYKEVKAIEYRDRILDPSETVIRNGETINKTQLCQRYGILTRNGSPDYRRLNQLLTEHRLIAPEYWDTIPSLRENLEFKREYLHLLDHALLIDSRQMYIGESE